MTLSVEYRLAELERRLCNLLRLGTVSELDTAAARVRVASGDLLTGWLPWFTRRAGNDSDWWAPEPGEQVLVLSPDGDPSQGLVLPAVYQDAHPAPAGSADIRRVEFSDGGYAQHDRSSGTLDVLAKGPVNVTAEGKVTITGFATVEVIGADGLPVKGLVQGDCLCAFTGQPHPMISSNVKGSI